MIHGLNKGQLANVRCCECLLSSSLELAKNVEHMGRKRVSRLNQPSVKKKKQITNYNVKKKIVTNSVRVELKKLSIEEKNQQTVKSTV